MKENIQKTACELHIDVRKLRIDVRKLHIEVRNRNAAQTTPVNFPTGKR